jgi:hypothetical protein
MRLSSAAFSLARGHVTRAAIGGRPSLPLLLARSKGVSVGARRFVGMVGRNKSTMTIGNAPSGGSGRTSIDPNVLFAAGTLLIGLFGHYFAMKSDFHRELDGVVKMLNSKLDAQDRKLDGQDRKIAGQDDTIAAQERKVEIFGEKIDLQYLKVILSKTNWSWFGLNSSPVKSENEHMVDFVSTVADNLNTKFEAIQDATKNLGTEIETMRKELNSMHNKSNAKGKEGISSNSKK